MRSAKQLLMLIALFAVVGNGWAQRKSQIEFYAGSAFPLSPDDFKEYTKVGVSGNAQYVIFPSPRLGITINVGYERFAVDNDKFTNALSTELTGQSADYWASLAYNGGTVRINPSSDLSSSLIRFGGGLRPYLTAPEASTQVFLLGQVNYNLITNNYSFTDLPYDYNSTTGILQWASFDDKTWEDTVGENDENVVGFGLGGGLEIPAGTSFNIVLQGLFNVISTKDESTSFVGVTAGLVF